MRKFLFNPLLVYVILGASIIMLVKSFQNLQEAELLFDRVEEYCQHIHNRQQETDPDIQIQPEGKELP